MMQHNKAADRIYDLVEQLNHNAENAWLNIGDVSKIKTANPFEFPEYKSMPMQERIISLAMRPEYLPWVTETFFGFRCHPFQSVILRELWTRPFPMIVASRGASKSSLFGIYALLRALLTQGSKVLIVGSAFRQAKGVFDTCSHYWHQSPMLRDLVGSGSKQGPHYEVDRCYMRLGDSTITAIPLGNGEKIRGIRSCLHPDTLVDTTYGLVRIEDCGKLMGKEDFAVYTGDPKCPVEKPKYFIQTAAIDAYEVNLLGKYSFTCSDSHKVFTEDGWKLAKDLTTDDRLIFQNDGEFPTKNVEMGGIELDEELAWLMGVLVSEGDVSASGRMSVRSTDREYLNRVEKAFYRFTPDNKISVYHTPEKYDDRGWQAKESWTVQVNCIPFRDLLETLGLKREKVHGKNLPWAILQSPKSVILSFLSSLFEGDGTAYLYKDQRWEGNFGVAYYSVSKQLTKDLQILMTKLGFFTTYGDRASKLSKKRQHYLRLYSKQAVDFAKLLTIPKWVPILEASRPIERSSERTSIPVKSVVKLPEPIVLYDFTLPKTQSFIAAGFRQHNTHLLIDEFKSVPLDIVENVVFGFAAVAASPIEKVQAECYKQYLIQRGVWIPEMNDAEEKLSSNQTVIGGTAWWGFSSFAQYYNRYKKFIQTQGDPEKYKRFFNQEMSPNFNYKDFSIIKLPAKLLPPKFMDEKILARTKATVSKANYLLEYGAVFVSDSDGFFKRSLVEGCVVGQAGKPISHPSTGEIFFKASMKGRNGCSYVIGVDPASQQDNFAVKVLEVWPDHRRLVYAWAARSVDYEKAKKRGLTKEQTFYSFCARKLRTLISCFSPCVRLSMDTQGGGRQIAEGLNDADKIMNGERKIWEIIDPDPKKKKESDDFAGDHILEWASFSSGDWLSQANHGLKKDFEDKVLLFPYYDHAEVQLAIEKDKEAGLVAVDEHTGEATRLSDTLEDCLENIEDLKDELSTIQHTETGSGRERWDVPDRKAEGMAKGRMRKDRYSALLIANAAARSMALNPDAGPLILPLVGAAIHIGTRSSLSPHHSSGPQSGPEWWASKVGSFKGVAVRGIK